MINSLDELLNALSQGKLLEHLHSNVELKRSWDRDYGSKISANANRVSVPVSWIVIGVNDDGRLAGRDSNWAKKHEEIISNHINQLLDPSQACQHLECCDLTGGCVIVLKIGNPGTVVTWDREARKISGTTTAVMTPEERMALQISLPGLHDYSAQKAASPYDESSIRRFCQMISKRSKPNSAWADLEKLPASESLSRLQLSGTQTARLLFGDAAFRVVFYDSAGHPLRNETCRPLHHALHPEWYVEACNWGGTRAAISTEHRRYSAVAFQEAIANAVAHAAYYERNGEIMLEIFPHHVCISNLCTNESKYFANRWFSRSHKSGNPFLMEFLRAAGYVDQLGRGKNLIFSESIINGHPAPYVTIEPAGRYNRWRLFLQGAPMGAGHIAVRRRLEQRYGDRQKALIAFALVLWRDRPVKEIAGYMDGTFARIFAEVLSDINGATFYSEKHDRLFISRWARLLIDEGVTSKALDDDEEDALYEFAQSIQTQYKNGYLTPQNLRELGQFGDSAGARTLASQLLRKWCRENKLEKLRRGHYRFPAAAPDTPSLFDQALKALSPESQNAPE